MAPLRISSSRRWRFFIFLINNSEIAKPHVALSQAFRIYQVWKNSCLTHTATLGIMKDLTQRPRTLVRQSCRRAHSACLPGTGSEQLSLDPPCARVRNALGCAACLSVRHGHTSLACWTHDEAVREKWKKIKVNFVQSIASSGGPGSEVLLIHPPVWKPCEPSLCNSPF